MEAFILNVHSDLFASIHVDPRWDPEHKLCLSFNGTITEINGTPFSIENGVLTLE